MNCEPDSDVYHGPPREAEGAREDNSHAAQKDRGQECGAGNMAGSGGKTLAFNRSLRLVGMFSRTFLTTSRTIDPSRTILTFSLTKISANIPTWLNDMLYAKSFHR